MLEQQREQVAAACHILAAHGFVARTSGNVSVRDGDHVAISPTGAELAQLKAQEVAVIDRDGRHVDGKLEPSSELGLHLAVYRRYDAGAVVHTHAPVATALSTVIDELPVVHYEMLLLGGAVRVAPYRTFGTPELADAVVEALEGRTAALMANHGALTFGPDLDGALRATELLEWACTVYWRAAALGTPRALGPDDRQAVIDVALRRGYGSTKEALEG